LVHSLSWFGSSDKVKPFTLKLDLFSISYKEFFVATIVLDLSSIIHLVLGLVVNENSSVSSSLKETIEKWLELWIPENLKRIIFSDLEDVCYD
jgi:hypothetical protein